MISAYNREVETEKEYNGRQLLELLQNADDERTDEVLIELDTINKTLIISNRGEFCTPFSFEGIRSLMISNLSSKTTKKYIGNKGLGFRSIINWSEKVTINSNGLDIVFSKDIVEDVYDELFDEQTHKEIVEDRKISENIKQIPFLSIPSIIDNSQSNWTTSVTINYKNEFLEDIKKQIHDLRNEILLFLNSIKDLVIIIDGEIQQSIKKEVLTEKWKIFEKSEMLPNHLWDKENEEEYYDLKIALQGDLSNDVKELFAYFPTKVQIDFPFIVHGTFELNSSRNGINDSPKNRYILKKLVELIVDTAKDITQEEVSYKALEMLTYTSQNNILEELEFYEAIDEAIDELEIFPCLDGQYRIMEEAIYANELSTFVQNTKHNDMFPNFLIPSSGVVDLDQYSISGAVDDELLNKLSAKIDNIDDRAELIHLLYNKFTVEDQLVFLIDSNKELIPLDDDVYTPSKLDLSMPDYVKIKFMHQELFEKLIIKFRIDSNEKARDLQRKLKELTNIQSYEPAQVLQKIVTSTNKELEKDGVNKVEIIKKMVRSLYENYMQLDKTKIPSETKIQLLNQDNSVTDAKNLFLSKTYPSGELTDYLFSDIFASDKFLADVSIFDFSVDDELEDIEQFFLWLGVNKHTKFYYKSYDHVYTSFVFKHIQKPVNYRDSSLRIKSIVNFDEIIKSLSYEKIVLWFYLDEKIHVQLDNNNNTDEFRYSKDREHRGYYSHRIYTKPSYILYQVLSSSIFKDYLVGNDRLSALINEKNFNFLHKAFDKYSINKSDIESTLLKIGAVDKFEKLSIETVSRVVKELPKKSPEGKAQGIYMLCIKHFERNKEPLQGNVSLFASKGGNKDYFPLNEVYYNGNIKLPKKITVSKAVLDYPRRQSTTKVINFFGINNLSSLEIEVVQKDTLQSITDEFNTLFEQIKSYILVYRLQDVETDKNARDELAKLQKINIQLCSDVQYRVDNELSNLEDNDYIKVENNYLIKIHNYGTLDRLRSDASFFDFQESFADIIGLAFDIQDTKVFRNMIKEDITYIEKTIRNDIGSDSLIRARELLGISDEYYSFWKTIYDLLDRNYIYESSDNILDLIQEDLKLKTKIENIDFSHLDTYESCKYIRQLFEELELDVEGFNNSESSYYKIDFTEFHIRNIKQAFDNSLVPFKKRLYTWCVKNKSERSFIDNIGIYNHNEQFISEQARKIKNKIDVDYTGIVHEFINDNFHISESTLTDVDFEVIYDANVENINIDDLNGDTEYLSLLYFENKIDEVKKYLNSIEDISIDEQDIKDDEPSATKPIIDTIVSTPPSTKPTRRKSKKPYKHNSGSEGRKKDIGNKSEKDVYDSLVEEYGKDNVVWDSKDDDSLGYDIRYKNFDGEWKYAEVKTYSGNQFYLSRNEREFAQKNIGLYEIFLVSDTIHRVVDVDFSDEDQFTLIENEFIVIYKLEVNLTKGYKI